jgi:tetratricopeptide (TPR) repeat protein
MTPLEEGIALADEGNDAEARTIFRRIIRSTPDEEEAWLWLAWVAEDKEESLRVLQEAKAILPQSGRIAEGLRWVEQELHDERADAQQEADEAPREPAQPEFSFSRVDDAARQAATTIGRAFGRARERAADIRVPRIDTERLQRIVAPLLSSLLVLGIVALVLLGISRARQKDRVVQALELPTRVPNATATPSVEQRTRSLWIQVDVSWTKGEWDTVIESLERIRAVDPKNAEARRRLAEAHYNRGLQCIEDNDLEAARMELDEAIRLDAGSDDLQQTRRCLSRYAAGLAAYWERDWDRAVEKLHSAYKLDPGFRDVEVMLAKSHYELGVELQENEVWDEAAEAYERTVELAPELEDADARLQQVMDILIPPNRIEVDLSERWVTVYENHKVIRSFICCTGRSNAPTLPGRYEVLDKLPMAYASKWNLKMPLWLGIYWAGGSQNGFHALPILSNGRTLWRNALGTGCSYGCIVLDNSDAQFLYDWAELGTVVLVER